MESFFRVIKHPLAQHCMVRLRDRETPASDYRRWTEILTLLLGVEASRDLETQASTVETPLETTRGQLLTNDPVLVPILRAGLGMVAPLVQLFPAATLGHLGLERDEETSLSSLYYHKLPDLNDRVVFLLDPMLATGGTAIQALEKIRSFRPSSVKLLCVVVAPEGLEKVHQRFPTCEVIATALDRELNANKYILPGLGDFGDRLFGT